MQPHTPPPPIVYIFLGEMALFFLALFATMAWCIVDCLGAETHSKKQKILWTVFLILAPMWAVFIYGGFFSTSRSLKKTALLSYGLGLGLMLVTFFSFAIFATYQANK